MVPHCLKILEMKIYDDKVKAIEGLSKIIQKSLLNSVFDLWKFNYR